MTEQQFADIQELSYEQAYDELEKIIGALESEQATLEESVQLFERGQALSQYCTELLEKAELRLKKLGPTGVEPIEE